MIFVTIFVVTFSFFSISVSDKNPQINNSFNSDFDPLAHSSDFAPITVSAAELEDFEQLEQAIEESTELISDLDTQSQLPNPNSAEFELLAAKKKVVKKTTTYRTVAVAPKPSIPAATTQRTVVQSTQPATAKAETKAEPAPQPKVLYSTISIPKISIIDQPIGYSSITEIDNLYTKMRQVPILENTYSSDFCTTGKNSYVMGHSEPSSYGETGAGLYVFARLNEVSPGDIITVHSANGIECTYKATGWESVVTDTADQISRKQFNQLFYPSFASNSALTIQTCQKGSSTVRLILRAEQV